MVPSHPKHHSYIWCKVVTLCIAAVWAINGLWCKLANMVPRHRSIVARILGDEFATEITMVIGVLELGMAVWVLSRYRPLLNAWAQALLVITMNLLEIWLAKDLLLFGAFNILLAIVFVLIVLTHGYRCDNPTHANENGGK